ncbi:MAG: hypothetical protein CME07_03375 [Gemmatimonadetes bacterium]|nr:hypothetical protein [Gemmatimonadota bacterium]
MLLPVVALLSAGWSPFGSLHEQVAKGNRAAAEAGAADSASAALALSHYAEAARIDPGSPVPDFNRGVLLAKTGDDEQSRDAFLAAAAAEDEAVRSGALYNLGNVLLGGDDAQGAIEAYLKSLDIDPGNPDARRNLEIAVRRLEEQQQQEQQQQDDPQEQESEENEDDSEDSGDSEEGEPPPETENPGEEETEESPPPEEPGEGEEEHSQQDRPREEQLSREDAERLLNAIETEELKVLEQLNIQEGEELGADAQDW